MKPTRHDEAVPVASDERNEQGRLAARLVLGEWLRVGRSARGLSLEEVAQVTKVRVPTLEALEGGDWSTAPAEVFLRGFVLSVAQTLGLAVADARRLFADAAEGEFSRANSAPSAAQTGSVRRVASQPGSSTTTALVAQSDATNEQSLVSASSPVTRIERRRFARGTEAPVFATETSKPALLSLVIDDANPEAAAASQELREQATSRTRVSLPSALTSGPEARQNGLTLAVIIVLIVATLTLSYLMRSPAPSSEGITTLVQRGYLA